VNRLISIDDVDGATLDELIRTGERLARGELDFTQALRGRLVGLLFSKPSTRTRTSFFAAVASMGGASIIYSAADLQTTTGEALEDTGMVLGLYLDALVMRTNGSHEEMLTMAESGGGLAVVNALSKTEHPTQAIADLITIRQEFGEVSGRHVLYIGAWNNTAASLVMALSKSPRTRVTLVLPERFAPDPGQLAAFRRHAAEAGSVVDLLHDPRALPRAVDVVYTTRWQSMGEEPDGPDWRESFRGFAVTRRLMGELAHERTIFMHDLPAHRGIEVEAEVLDGPASRIRRQSFNKMISAMCVLERCLRGRPVRTLPRQSFESRKEPSNDGVAPAD
jgi:ornithine carbamoyltransferase